MKAGHSNPRLTLLERNIRTESKAANSYVKLAPKVYYVRNENPIGMCK